MIREIINFTNNLSERFKNGAHRPSKGLHIFIKIIDEKCSIDDYVYYNGTGISDDNLNRALSYELRSSYITMNQQQKFDNKQKIHSASPFSLAFNFSLGKDKAKIGLIHNEIKGNMEDKDDEREFDLKLKEYKFELVKGSIENYFSNAKRLCLFDESDELKKSISTFQEFCKVNLWGEICTLTMQKNVSRKKESKEFKDVNILGELNAKDTKTYIRVYLADVDLKTWEEAYTHYYEGEYPPNELKDNDFISTFPDKKPFMTHRTASFETVKISGKDAKTLKTFKEILALKPKVIPNPLPIFIYEDEIQNEVIALFNDKEKNCGYKEMIETLWEKNKKDISNYYLVDWYVGKDIVFQDFDFVPKFEFELYCQIINLFDIREKGSKASDKNLKYYSQIRTVFEFEDIVFKSLLQNKYLKLEYFSNLKSDDYEKYDNTFQAYAKYRKAVYDFVYKSRRQGIDARIFTDMVFSHIKDDIKNNNEYSIKDKLNIWFSLYENFDHNKNNNVTMASKLKDYQEFVSKLAVGQADLDNAQDTHFAFAAGQVIEYVIQKSKTDNKSYQLLEPYLQQSKCTEFKKALANDIARYKHAINDNETRFRNVCAFVQTYDTDRNLKELLPEILAGVFSKNEFFTTLYEKKEN